VCAGLTEATAPLLVTVSRSILYADASARFAKSARAAARRVRDTIERIRKEVAGQAGHR
jgi:hypothetical protein